MASNISGIDGAPSPSQVLSVGAGRPVSRPQDASSGGTSSAKDGVPQQDVQITVPAKGTVTDPVIVSAFDVKIDRTTSGLVADPSVKTERVKDPLKKRHAARRSSSSTFTLRPPRKWPHTGSKS